MPRALTLALLLLASPAAAQDPVALTKDLTSPDAYVRWRACLALQRLGPRAAGAREPLAACARGTDRLVGRQAILALGELAREDAAAARILGELLVAPDVGDPGAALYGLLTACEVPAATAPWLVRSVQMNAHGHRRRALAVLRRLRPAPALLLPLMGLPDVATRRYAVGALRDAQATPAVLASMLRAAADEDTEVRLDAIAWLGSHDGASPEVTRALVTALDDEEVAVAAAQALGKRKTRAAIPALVAALDDWPCVRRASETALDACGARCLVELIRMREVDGCFRVRFDTGALTGGRAAQVLALCRDPEIGDDLVATLATLVDATALEALRALAADGADPAARAVADAIVRRADNPG